MNSNKPKRAVSYCPIYIQNKMNDKIRELSFFEKDFGDHREFVNALPSISRQLVKEYLRLQNIAIEFELSVEHSNEINKYKGILK